MTATQTKGNGMLLETLKKYEAKHYFRFQPKGTDVKGYKSMDYLGTGEIDGVWAFGSLVPLIRDLMESDSYADQIENPELVVISGEVFDDAEDFYAISDAEVVARVDVDQLRSELSAHLDEDGDLAEDFINWLES
jgi:hypothetical protein